MFKGIVQEVWKLELVGERKTQKQVIFVKEDKEEYPQSAAFTFIGKSTEYLTHINVWDEVEVKFNLNSTEYNGKRYNNVNGYSCVVTKKAPEVEEQLF
jgi:hypothetical protein